MYLSGYHRELLYNEMRPWVLGQKAADARAGAIQLERAKWAQMRQSEVNGLGGYGKAVHSDDTAVNRRRPSALKMGTRKRGMLR